MFKDDKERFIGAILGLAVGDALGAPLEFRDDCPYPNITEMHSCAHLPGGYWTDDTSMALCIIDSMVNREVFDLKDQMDNFVKWYKEGFLSSRGYCFDIGNTIREALDFYIHRGEINTEIDTFDNNLSNGALMRLAPVPLYYHNNVREAAKKSIEHTILTHPSVMCCEASALFSTLLTCCFHDNMNKQALLQDVVGYAEELFPGLEKWFREFVMNPQRPNTEEHSGYVMTSLEMALWAFLTTKNFNSGAIECINWGGDTDTYAAIYGQLAGTYYGYASIKESWTRDLYQCDKIIEFALMLFNLKKRK